MSVVAALAAVASFSGVAHVVDGDTLRVGTTRVRLFGVDAPELAQRCGPERRTPCGRQAAEWLRTRVEGRPVACVRVDVDRYGRIVARCRAGGADVGSALVGAGWATAYRRYSLDYVRVEDLARRGRRGIWSLGFQAPAAYRAERRAASGTPPPDPSCAIKGNINSKGARIFHLPGTRDYAAVRIDTRKGERWFCSQTQAIAAGWRPRR